MIEFYMISGMALVTFLIRYTPFVASGEREFPETITRALRYVPPAVLTAIIVPAVCIPTGETVQLTITNAYLVGAIIAGIVGWFRRNLLLTIVVGMMSFLGWQYVVVTWLN